MTGYSISPENLPPNRVSPPELDSLDWESRMARLVGLEEESSSVNTDQAVEESTSLVQPSSEPQEVRTKEPLSSNPFAKLGLVGAGTLGIVLVAGVFLSQLINPAKQQPKKNNSVSTRSQPITDSRPQQLQSELETLKTKLALTEQAEAVKAAQQKLRLQKPTPTQIASRPTPKAQRSASVNTPRIPLQRIQTPVRTVYVPRTVTIERIVKAPSVPQKAIPQKPIPQKAIAQKPANSQILPSRLPIVAPNTRQIVTATPKPTPDPLQEWAKLAKLGSYGMVSITGTSAVQATPPPPPNNTRLQARNTDPDDEPEEESTPPAVSQTKQQTPKSVAVGTKAKAVFATAVFGETTRQTTNSNRKDESGKDVFVATLKEPLKSVDGAIALPAKTQFLAQLRSISEQGFVQLDVVKVILPNNNSFIEKSLPPNALTIRAPQGKPLIASQFSNQGGSTVLSDVAGFVLSGTAKAAEIYNRPDYQYFEYCSDYPEGEERNACYRRQRNRSNNSSRRNILAGVLEGGATNIANQFNQRNQQAISRRQNQRTNVWVIPAGKEVELYVNQTFQP
ncbi:TrbI/VirB10 family protein [Tolypothrix sp. VBCCA 56010]|uniref:TrbI/VirB10 family protein n=1 Tax=Tolypothrix sp. VBCCA 56010 TaxID=3137731 RepID=UPI003D7D8C3E